ncbi:MAG: hypothetical protein K6F70_08100 [Eggerthellaceae bacterium]|nr:hypothetical protein [Eggerthellaceae bacterium]
MEGKLSRHALFGAFFAVALACSALFGFSAVPQAYADDSTQLVAQGSVAANLPDAEKQETLLNNLIERFAATGGDEAITNGTYYAALAQNVLGLHINIDVESIEKSVVGYLEETPEDKISAGTLAKYITALHAGGVDCTSVEYGGETYNLIDRMNAAMNADVNEDSLRSYNAVCILPVYTFGYDMSGAKYTQADFVQAILGAQQEDDLFGQPYHDYGAYKDAPDVQTSSQALLALALVKGENADIESAAHAAIAEIKKLQMEDGSFAYASCELGWDPSLVDSTSIAVAALSAWNVDVTDGSFVTSNGSTPLGYLVASANSSLDRIETQYGEEMSASSVFLALATVKANADQGALLNPLDVKYSMFRLYNPNSGEHFYTKSPSERENVVKAGWTYEGCGWVSPDSSSAPVYRLYNPNGGDHHYTVSVEERDWLVGLGWRYEGIGWYSDTNETIPVYRQYNPNADTGSHNFTTSAEERDGLVALGWHDESIAWYGVK